MPFVSTWFKYSFLLIPKGGQLVYRDYHLPLCAMIEQIFMEKLLYTLDNVVCSNLPLKYYLPPSQ